MKKSNHLNILLVEILIAILFFSLASTVILKVYASTHRQMSLAETTDEARTMIQNLSEKCYVADSIPELLSANGFAEEDGKFLFRGDKYLITAVIDNETTDAGMLRNVSFSATVDEESVISLNATRYIPEVAAQ